MPRFRAALLGVLAVSLAVVPVAPPAAAADDRASWTSLFASGPLQGAGWSACNDPIRVSVDTRLLQPSQAAKAKQAVVIALSRWNISGAVRFEYGGEVPMRFDPASGVATPEDGVARDRWVYLTLVDAPRSSGPHPQIVGVAGPLRVYPEDRTIVEGSAAFLASFVNRQPLQKVARVFAHELGHVAGLGHSTSRADIMYPVIRSQRRLGPGDIAGIRAILRPCGPAPTPAG